MLFVNFVMGLSRFESSLCLLMIIKVVKAVLLPIVPSTSDLNDISSNGHMAPLERVLLSKDLKRESSLRPGASPKGAERARYARRPGCGAAAGEGAVTA